MSQNNALNERLEGFAWGLFLVTLGGLWLLPSASVPDDAWLIAAGAGSSGVRLPLFAVGVIAIGLFIMARHLTPHDPRLSKTA